MITMSGLPPPETLLFLRRLRTLSFERIIDGDRSSSAESVVLSLLEGGEEDRNDQEGGAHNTSKVPVKGQVSVLVQRVREQITTRSAQSAQVSVERVHKYIVAKEHYAVPVSLQRAEVAAASAAAGKRTTEVCLAFPITITTTTIVEDVGTGKTRSTRITEPAPYKGQHHFTFLPVGPTGLPFMVQADMLLTAR
jgi:hypothetical protein